ncbi:hypothetical protein C8R47DRAFT_1072314 [Mycena vitilis]|nr:hypothetical protein C8R47DRAFT_1072314 [Mycena vitilis]
MNNVSPALLMYYQQQGNDYSIPVTIPSSQYFATVHCLRILDPQGVLLFEVADPLRRYLKSDPEPIDARPAALTNLINLGVLRETEENTFLLLEAASSSTRRHRCSVDGRAAAEMRLYWKSKFIDGMLRSLLAS